MKKFIAVLLSLVSVSVFASTGSVAGTGASTTYSSGRSLPGNPSTTTQDAQRGGPSLDRTNPDYLENDYNAPCPVGRCDTSGNNYPRINSRDND